MGCISAKPVHVERRHQRHSNLRVAASNSVSVRSHNSRLSISNRNLSKESRLSISNRNQSKESLVAGTQWAVMLDPTEARKKFYHDGTLPLSSSAPHLELRELLENPYAQSELMKHARKVGSMKHLCCWLDIQEFKSIPISVFRRTKALSIYYKYLHRKALMAIDGIEDEERVALRAKLMESKDNERVLVNGLFNAVQRKCFLEIHYQIYRPFCKCPEHANMMKEIKNSYNKVTVDDFVYHRRLGGDV